MLSCACACDLLIFLLVIVIVITTALGLRSVVPTRTPASAVLSSLLAIHTHSCCRVRVRACDPLIFLLVIVIVITTVLGLRSVVPTITPASAVLSSLLAIRVHAVVCVYVTC